MKAGQMLVLTNMLAKIISELDDVKAMIKESTFEEYFEVCDLEFDEWNNIDGLEVKPVYSPHPVETNILFFRTLWEDGYATYAHLADVASHDILNKMLQKNKKKPEIKEQK